MLNTVTIIGPSLSIRVHPAPSACRAIASARRRVVKNLSPSVDSVSSRGNGFANRRKSTEVPFSCLMEGKLIKAPVKSSHPADPVNPVIPFPPFACLAYFAVKKFLSHFCVPCVLSRPTTSPSVLSVYSRENEFANRCKSTEVPFSCLVEGEAHEDSC